MTKNVSNVLFTASLFGIGEQQTILLVLVIGCAHNRQGDHV